MSRTLFLTKKRYVVKNTILVEQGQPVKKVFTYQDIPDDLQALKYKNSVLEKVIGIHVFFLLTRLYCNYRYYRKSYHYSIVSALPI